METVLVTTTCDVCGKVENGSPETWLKIERPRAERKSLGEMLGLRDFNLCSDICAAAFFTARADNPLVEVSPSA